MRRSKSDCDILIESAEDVFHDVGNCFESAFDDKQSKMSVVGSLFNLGKSLTKLTLNTGVCAVKNAPKAVVAVAAVKREIVNAIEEEVQQQQKQAKLDALDLKIKNLQYKSLK